MKTLLKSVAVTAIIVLSNLISNKAKAQTPSSHIMDATIEWSSGNGTLKVFLTDTVGLQGLQCGLGTAADTMDVYLTSYNISGNSFGSGGTVTDNVLSVPLGNYPTGTDYFSRIRVLLSNNSYNEIEVKTSN